MQAAADPEEVVAEPAVHAAGNEVLIRLIENEEGDIEITLHQLTDQEIIDMLPGKTPVRDANICTVDDCVYKFPDVHCGDKMSYMVAAGFCMICWGNHEGDITINAIRNEDGKGIYVCMQGRLLGARETSWQQHRQPSSKVYRHMEDKHPGVPVEGNFRYIPLYQGAAYSDMRDYFKGFLLAGINRMPKLNKV